MSSPTNTKIVPTDLTQRPPRSFHVRLGGFVILPRMLDKGRATLAKNNGENNYDSSAYHNLVRFVLFGPDGLLQVLAAGKGDREIVGCEACPYDIAHGSW